MSSSYNAASKKSLDLADRLAKLKDPRMVEQVIAKTTAQAQEIIVDNITHNVRPHDAHRIGGFVSGATDLVDTGQYRSSFQISFPTPYIGRVASNISYAAALEYGTPYLKGFFVVRDSAKEAKKLFIKNFQEALRQRL